MTFIQNQILLDARLDGAIFDFELLKALDEEQFKAQALALLHMCFEIASNVEITPSSADFVKEAVQILHKYTFQYVKNR